MIAVGQIWKEVDGRFERQVLIKRIGAEHALIRSVFKNRVGQWVVTPRSRDVEAKLERFNGKRGGYGLVEDVA